MAPKPATGVDRDRGGRIKGLRESLRESQAAFGERFNVEQATVSRWEQGAPIVRSLWSPLSALAGRTMTDFIFGAASAVPLLSWVAAGSLSEIGDVPAHFDAPILPVADLPARGDWFALRVEGDSMDRVAPDGSVILVNRQETSLIPRKFYVFEDHGAATFKRYVDRPPRLEPFSTNPVHETIFPKANPHVIGRVCRVLVDL